MKFKIKGKDVELKYTFNSFRYMEDLEVKELEEMETKPFKVPRITQTLLIGAVNHSPNKKFSEKDVYEALEKYVEKDSVATLLEELSKLLEKSAFFKNLQEK